MAIMTWRFWLATIYLGVCVINYLGLDDKNLLLFFTSPAAWLPEGSPWFVRNVAHPSKIMGSISGLSLAIWYLVGLGIDFIVKKIQRGKSV